MRMKPLPAALKAGTVVALLITSALLARQFAVIWATGENGQPATMSLKVESPSATCDNADKPSTCNLPADSAFTLSIAVTGLPEDPNMNEETGYVAFQSELYYEGLNYSAADTAGDEIVWPDSALPVRAPAAPTGFERTVAHGDAGGTSPPLTPSGHTGNIVEVTLSCPAEPQRDTLALLPYDAVDRPLGAGFKLVDGKTGGFGQTVPARTTGQQALDLDGEPDTPPETVDVAATLRIICGEPETPTTTSTDTAIPTATATPTATPTPTPTLQPPAAPTGLEAIVVQDALMIELRWQDNADNEASYIVERSLAGAGGPWSVLATLPADSSSYFDSGLEDSVTYWYRVAAANGAGLSGYSNVVFGTATALPTPPIGDVNCDLEANSIDAALVLQLTAGLVGALPCQANADANEDGSINSIDAALILQYGAGLIPGLPPP